MRFYRIRVILILLCLWIISITGCKKDDDDSSIIEVESTSNYESSEESSYFIDESSNIEPEESTEYSHNTSYPEESSQINTEDTFVLTEQDAIDFYERIVLACTTESSFPLFRHQVDIEQDKTSPISYTSLLGIYSHAASFDSSIEVSRDLFVHIDEESIPTLVEAGILSDQDVTWIESQIVGTGYLSPKTDIQNAVNYFYGKDTICIEDWILQREDGTWRFYETSNNEYYIRWVAGSGSYSTYFYSLCGTMLNGETGSVDVHCIKMTAAGNLMVQDVATEKEFEDLDYYYFINSGVDELDNDQMFQALLEAEEIDISDLGTIRFDFFKDEIGVHYKDIHYLSKNVFHYIGEKPLLVYNSPSFDDLKEDMKYAKGYYLTIYNIHDGWGEIRNYGNTFWVRMDFLVPMEDFIIEYPYYGDENEDSENAVSSETELSMNVGAYQPILDYYSRLMEEKKGKEYFVPGKYEYGNGSELVNYTNSLGYQLLDIDGNGIEEMIIGMPNNETYPKVIIDLYTLIDNTPVQVNHSWERSRLYLLDNNQLYLVGSSGAANEVRHIYELQVDQLVIVDGLESRLEDDMTLGWYRGVQAYMYSADDKISEEEASLIKEEWDSYKTELFLISFFAGEE